MKKEKNDTCIMKHVEYIIDKKNNPDKYLCKECNKEKEYSKYNIEVYREDNWVEIKDTAHLCEKCLMRKKGIFIDMDEEDEEKRFKFLN